MSLNGTEAEVKLNFHEEGERMVRDVDEAYWRDYFETHNARRFKELVS
jgi:hypothetical protein